MKEPEETGYRGGIKGAILVLAVAGFASTCWEVNAARAKEVYSTKAQVYRGIVDELGRLEGVAHELQGNVSAWEASQDTVSDILARDYIRDAREIQDEIRRLPFPPEVVAGESKAMVAAQRSWAELQALQMCVEGRLLVRGPATSEQNQRGIKNELDQFAARGLLTTAQVDSIVADAAIAAPCARNYSSASLQELKLNVADTGWKQLEGPWLTRLFTRFL